MSRSALTFLLIIAVILIVWITAFVLCTAYEKDVMARPWPMDLGAAKDVAKRYPPVPEPSEGALALERLTAPLGFSLATAHSPVGGELRSSLGDYVKAETETDAPIDPPSDAVAEFLRDHDGHLAAIREHLLSGVEIAWVSDYGNFATPPMPNVLSLYTLHRCLVASSLARSGINPIQTWEDLHAAWEVLRSLRNRPESVSQTVAISMAREILAVARKLPAPAPHWLAEVEAYDPRRATLAAYQAETAMLGAHVRNHLSDVTGKPRWRHAVDLLARPYTRLLAGNLVELARISAHELAVSRVCGFDETTYQVAEMKRVPRWNFIGRMGFVSLAGPWSRVARFDVERDAMRIALAVRSGVEPDLGSRCVDGSWRNDGGTIRFSKQFGPQEGMVEIPLEITLANVKP